MNEALHIDQGTVWYLPEIQNLRLMRARYVHHAFKPHAHDYFVVGIIEKGLQTFTYKREKLVTAPGELIVINPGEIHTGESALPEGFTYRALYPSLQVMDAITEEFSVKQSPAFTPGVVKDKQLFQWFKRLHQHSEHSGNPLEIEEDLTRFLIALVHRHATGHYHLKQYQSAHDAVRTICDLLESSFAENVTLSELSRLVNISPFHLTRLFKKHTGLPPHRYLENIRIRQAEQLLNSGMAIAEVAFATGFSSQSHLTRAFKRIMGTTPGEFVKYSKIV